MDGTDGAYWEIDGMLNSVSFMSERTVCLIISGHWNSKNRNVRRKVKNYLSETFRVARDLMLAGF